MEDGGADHSCLHSVASQIKPRNQFPTHRLDPKNGPCLSSLHDPGTCGQPLAMLATQLTIRSATISSLPCIMWSASSSKHSSIPPAKRSSKNRKIFLAGEVWSASRPPIQISDC